jgi:hypothetical protein
MRGRRGLTLSYFVTVRFLEWHLQKGKEIVGIEQEQSKIGRRHCFALAGNTLYKRETKQRCAILTLVLYIWNGWCVHFRDKRRHTRFRDGRRNGRHVRFRDKRRHAPKSACLLYLHNRRHAVGARVSLLSQKWTHLKYKLNWDVLKRRSSHFYPPLS